MTKTFTRKQIATARRKFTAKCFVLETTFAQRDAVAMRGDLTALRAVIRTLEDNDVLYGDVTELTPILNLCLNALSTIHSKADSPRLEFWYIQTRFALGEIVTRVHADSPENFS